MRIPAEILSSPYPNESDRFADTHGTRPVNGSARLPSDLPEGFPKPRQTPEASAEHGQQAARPDDGGSNSPERRRQDRRQKNVPTTLDTRLTRSRRSSASPINIEI